MKIAYAFIYYVIVAFIGATFLLGLLYIRKIRNMIFSLSNKMKGNKIEPFKIITIIVLSVILIVMVDAVTTYFSAKSALGNIDGMKIDLFDRIQAHEKEDYVSLYLRLREFYMAERNFMLTCSALVTIFIFNRVLAAFRKWFEMEAEFDKKPVVTSS